MGVNKRIRLAIDELGLSLKEVSERTGLTYRSLQNWIGNHREPRLDALVAFASELEISLYWLMKGEGPMLCGDQPSTFAAIELTPREEQLLSIFRGLADQDQQEVQRIAEEKKRMTDLEARLKELEAAVSDSKKLA